jgi:two-component system sensor histidine kinase/response regulator
VFAAELLRSEGLIVDEAVNGQHALDMARAGRYDAVLMDVQMPVMDGLEATRQIRALAATEEDGERFTALPIIAMTALAMAHDTEASKAAGMNDHVSKPIAPERLLATLARAMGAREPANPNAQPAALAPIPLDLLALTTLDTREGIRRIGGNADAYRKQLRRFRDNYRNADTILLKLLDNADLKDAGDFCHALVGVTGNMGARALYEQLGTISSMLKIEQQPQPGQMVTMARLLAAVVADIDGLSDGPESGSSREVGPLQGMRLITMLAKLEQTLQFDLGRTEGVIAELRRGTTGTAEARAIEEIAAKADAFAIDEAVALTGALRQRLTPAT